MSAPSPTASQTDFCNTLYLVNATPEPPSGCDTPIPITGISDGTFNYILSTIISGTEDDPRHPQNETKILRPSIAMGSSLALKYAYLFMDRFQNHHITLVLINVIKPDSIDLMQYILINI